MVENAILEEIWQKTISSLWVFLLEPIEAVQLTRLDVTV